MIWHTVPRHDGVPVIISWVVARLPLLHVFSLIHIIALLVREEN